MLITISHEDKVMNKLYPLVIGFILLFQGNLFSQDNKSDEDRPKIGVVLSGGGAKGIAHIGVLKALEEVGLRPDYITGTSMGGIMGGLYALGYSASQLDTIIRSINWDLALSNNIPLDYIAYEEKEYYNRFLVELPIENAKLKLPTGLIQGQMLGEILARYTWPARNYKNFDEFPIPFRCVATDVSTGKPIVFKDGSLAKALRATMAIPSAFSAVDLDTTLAVDGGVVNNFPVEELFNMGADYVIGVNVSHGFKSAYEIKTMTGILLQIAMIPSSERLDDQIKLCDIYITPELENYSTASFSSYEDILRLGYESGEKIKPQFQALADSLDIQQSVIPAPLINPEPITIGKITVIGNELVTENLIRSKLHIEEGDVVTRGKIEKGVRAVYGVYSFKKVVYRLAPLSEPGHYELTIKTIEKTPVNLKGSVHFDNIFGIGIVMNVTMRNLLGKSSRTIVTGDISENPKFRFDYLKYIGHKERIAVDLRYNWANEEIPSYEDGLLKDLDISKEQNLGLSFMTTQSLKSSFLVGINYHWMRQKQKFYSVIPEGVKQGVFNFGRAEVLFKANTFNDRNYPVSGRELAIGGQFFFHNNYSVEYEKDVDTVYISIDVDDVTLKVPITEDQFNDLVIKPIIPDPYGKLQFSYLRFINFNRWFQFIPGLMGGVTLSTDSAAIFDDFRIGGSQRVRYQDTRFLGLNYAEADYPNFAIASLLFQNVIIKKIFLKYGAQLLLPYEHVPLNDLDQFSSDVLFSENSMIGYGLEATLKSFIGPISLGISRNSRDSYFRYYFAIGFSFNYSD